MMVKGQVVSSWDEEQGKDIRLYHSLNTELETPALPQWLRAVSILLLLAPALAACPHCLSGGASLMISFLHILYPIQQQNLLLCLQNGFKTQPPLPSKVTTISCRIKAMDRPVWYCLTSVPQKPKWFLPCINHTTLFSSPGCHISNWKSQKSSDCYRNLQELAPITS